MAPDNLIKFAVLSYFPSIIAKENINVGIIFFNVDTNERRFDYLRKWSRLQSFDDELDVTHMKDYLHGMKSQVEESLLNTKKDFDIDQFTRYYVNELRFSSVKSARFDNFEEFVILTKNIHMKLDIDSHERLGKDSEIKYIKSLLRYHNIEFSGKPIVGKYDENILFDFTVGDYGFKNFEFEDKNIKSMITKAKYWAYNAMTLKGRFKTIFTYDDDNVENVEELRIIMQILREHAYKVIKNKEVPDFLLMNSDVSNIHQTAIHLN